MPKLSVIFFKIYTDVKLFDNEASIYKHIHHHNPKDSPLHVPLIYGSFIEPSYVYINKQSRIQRYYIIMEYIDGKTLDNNIGSDDQVLSVFTRIYQATNILYEMNICHLDFHQYNAIVTKDCEIVYLIDFEKSIMLDENKLIQNRCYTDYSIGCDYGDKDDI